VRWLRGRKSAAHIYHASPRAPRGRRNDGVLGLE
jgi:hypothetical protein